MPSPPYRRRPLRHRRRGYTLVVFALLLFCLMALAALVIDLGMARVAQRQMQTAVDSAALEGLRGRDRTFDAALMIDPNVERRLQARLMVQATFDDDLDPNTADVRYFGAGPIYNLGASIGSDPALAAGQHLAIDPARVYKPVPELNETDEPHGDLVAGTYDANDLAHHEDAVYARSDFQPQPGGDAFLARLRRSNDFEGLDNIGGISQAGPTLPYLFGRGSLIQKLPQETYSPREHGITLRATAIAHARRAKGVGRSAPTEDIPGAMAIALYRPIWEGSLPAISVTLSDARLTVEIDGNVTFDDASDPGDDVNPEAAGHAVEDTGTGGVLALGAEQPTVPLASTPDQFVDALLAAAPGDPALVYVAILPHPANPATTIPDRIIGFGCCEVRRDPSDSPNQFRIARRENRVASINATAALIPLQSGAAIADLDESQREDLFEQHEAFSAPLLVPALVR